MTTVELVNDLLARGVLLEVVGDRVRYEAPAGVLTPQLRELLAGHRAEVVDLLRRRRSCPTCGGVGRCEDRLITADGGWACRAAVDAGIVSLADDQVPLPGPARRPGWSVAAVLPCPACGNRAYSIPPQGRPWRRCTGPRGRACGHTWNPESDR